MIISHEEKFVFIRNPKTASRSITEFLKNKYRVFDCNDYHHWVVPQSCKNYCIFVFVRNPFSRCVSAYNHVTSDRNKIGRRFLSFEDFVYNKYFDIKVKHSKVLNLFSQAQFINMIKQDSNIENIKICKYENLRTELYNLNFINVNDIAHIGMSDAKNSWITMFDSKLEKHFVESIPQDFENFGYSKNINDYNFTNRLLL